MYELVFGPYSIIHQTEDSEDIQTRYNFIKIDTIANMAPKSLVDVLAIVTSATDVEERISPKDGSILLKRDLIILDDSNTEITLTLWGDKASDTNVNFNNSNLTVAIKGTYIHRINKQIYYMMFLSYILFIKYS